MHFRQSYWKKLVRGAIIIVICIGACHFCAAGRLEHTVRGGLGGV